MMDAHQHYWKVERGDYGWMSPDLTELYRDFGPASLAPHLARSGVSRTILVQAAETEAETDFLLEIAASTDSVAGVVGWLDMYSDSFSERLEHYWSKPKWVGLRPMLQEHLADRIVDTVFLKNMALVAEREIPFDVLVFSDQLPQAVEALQKVSGLKAVVDHLAKPKIAEGAFEAWAAHMSAIAELENVSCKVSGMITEAASDWRCEDFRPFVAHVADVFGPDRLMFGSDWPVCTLAGSYSEVLALARTLLSERFGPEDLKNIFETNAAKFYGV